MRDRVAVGFERQEGFELGEILGFGKRILEEKGAAEGRGRQDIVIVDFYVRFV